MTAPADAGFSTEWFVANIPHWERWLGPLRGRAGLRALEIGSFEGRAAVWLLENILTDPSSSIDCIDLFRPNGVYADFHERFRANTAPWGARVREHAGPSFEMLPRMQGPFDIVYVDGWHTAWGTLSDGVMSWPLLKVGGVMIFDDYLWLPPDHQPLPRPSGLARKLAHWRGSHWRRDATAAAIARIPAATPKLGIDSLLAALDGHYELIGKDYQLAVRKTREFSDE